MDVSNHSGNKTTRSNGLDRMNAFNEWAFDLEDPGTLICFGYVFFGSGCPRTCVSAPLFLFSVCRQVAPPMMSFDRCRNCRHSLWFRHYFKEFLQPDHTCKNKKMKNCACVPVVRSPVVGVVSAAECSPTKFGPLLPFHSAVQLTVEQGEIQGQKICRCVGPAANVCRHLVGC